MAAVSPTPALHRLPATYLALVSEPKKQRVIVGLSGGSWKG